MTETGTGPSERRLALIRVAVGLAQGLALFGLSETRTRFAPVPFGVLATVAMFAPVVVLGALGAARGRTFAVWAAAATAMLALAGGYQQAMRWDATKVVANWPDPPVLFLLPPLLFICHALVLAWDADRRWPADYPRYFETAWTGAVRVALALAFLGAFWLLIFIGSGLFSLIKVTVFWETVREPGFAFPASGVVFATAVHLTDRSANLVRGVRTLALGLLSWLGPVMTLIALGFLAALPFTGLEPLWETKRATGILLAAAAALAVLVNAAYQDGLQAPPPLVLRWSGRIAALLLSPLAGLALVGVGLRIGQHGLTPERVMAAAFVFVTACYAAGYLIAAVRLGSWLKGMERANLVGAHVAAVVLLLLITPIGDPARLSVANQLGRLSSGKVSPEAFDYGFLRFDAGRIGHDALEKLATEGRDAEVRRRAKMALAANARSDLVQTKPARAIQAPEKPLPADFITNVWSTDNPNDPFELCARAERDCVARQLDLDSDGMAEVVVVGEHEARVYRRTETGWEYAGRLQPNFCEGTISALERGDFKVVAPSPAWREILVDGRRLRLSRDNTDCARELAPAMP